MARKPITDLAAWPSLTLEGNLISPAMVSKIDQRDASDQSEDDYKIRKGLTVRDEISTAFRVGQSHFDTFSKLTSPSAEATRRFVLSFLKETFGFDDVERGKDQIAFVAGKRVPIVVVPPDELIDRRSPTLSSDISRSPAFVLQDWLNDHDEALWGLVTNGTRLRLMRDNASLTRPAFIEADLFQIFANEDAASFAALWLIVHRTRFGAVGAPATDCALERWREAGSREGETARDRLADQVQIALKALGSGFLESNPDLARKLQSGEINLTEWFNELLRLIYRLIFLMVAEDRNLLHPEKAKPEARKLYAEGYSLAALRAQCFRAASWDKHHDRFEGIKVIFRALAHGEDRLALPALGGLFAEDGLHQLATARLRNRALMEALYRLSWLSDKTGMVSVNWRAMETEELGSVYESLLELQPQLGVDGKTLLFASEVAEQKGNQRKTTGSYYTPDSLVQALLDSALDPILDKTEAESDDPAARLLQLSVIDPACGSGHFLLAAARRIAARLARIRAEGTPSLADFRHALRDVTRCCIHGVDRNPMAVELTKVALWIESVDPGLPLGFLEAQIRCGDALLGVFDLKELLNGIPDAAYKPLTGDDKDSAKYYQQANRAAKSGQGGFDFGAGEAILPTMKPLALEFSGFRGLPEDTVEQISAKTMRFEEIHKSESYKRTAAAADLYVASFIIPKFGPPPQGATDHKVPITQDVWRELGERQTSTNVTEAISATRRTRALHWPLEFPDVMQRGGFDVVLGNPPWEVMQLDEEEYFAARKPEIASLEGGERKRAIAKLEVEDPKSFLAFHQDKRLFEAHNEFVRASGRFKLTARGKLNTYSLFAELFTNLSKRYAGLIVPTGIATDATTAPFFAYLVKNRRLASLIDFENRAGFFPAVDSRMKFALLTISREEPESKFAFFMSSTAELLAIERNFTLTSEEIAAINPNTNTAPVFRSRADAQLVSALYRRQPIIALKHGNTIQKPWEFQLRQGMFNKSVASDSGYLVPMGSIAKNDMRNWLAATEGEYGFLFDHRYSTFENGSVRIANLEEKRPDFEPNFELAYSRAEFERGMERWQIPPSIHSFLAFRRVSRSTDERTVIAAILPKMPMSYGWLIAVGLNSSQQVQVIGNFASLVFDYTMRCALSQPSIPIVTAEQLPIIPPSFYTPSRFAFIAPLVLELTYTSFSLADFARDLGHGGPPFTWNEDHRAHLRATLDAFYARAYGLSREELRYILDPADVKGPDYPSETFRVLKEKETRHHGEFRTRRLVLEAWDRMETSGEFKSLEI